MNEPISVWKFYDAPEKYRKLSGHGGDEDWLAFIPSSTGYDYVGWCDPDMLGQFGCCDIEEHKVKGGVVRIGAHA